MMLLLLLFHLRRGPAAGICCCPSSRPAQSSTLAAVVGPKSPEHMSEAQDDRDQIDEHHFMSTGHKQVSSRTLTLPAYACFLTWQPAIAIYQNPPLPWPLTRPDKAARRKLGDLRVPCATLQPPRKRERGVLVGLAEMRANDNCQVFLWPWATSGDEAE